MIGSRIEIDLPNVHIIRDYPNSQYFRGFDAVVQAGGYNSFHETRAFGLPALFYPNMETGMDDQLARCKIAEEEGWGIVNTNRTKPSIQKDIISLLQRTKVQKRLGENGATEIARILLDY